MKSKMEKTPSGFSDSRDLTQSFSYINGRGLGDVFGVCWFELNRLVGWNFVLVVVIWGFMSFHMW